MKKVLVIGLGGSGGKTVGFLMDEALAQIKDMGWKSNRLPDCWSFVHIDVPPSVNLAVAGTGLTANVTDQFGHYIPVTNPGALYSNIDQVVFNQFSNSASNSSEGLRDLLKWRPNPDGIAATIDITGGAGAFRAIGRTLTLAAGDSLYKELKAVVSNLMNVSSEDGVELARVIGDGAAYDASDSPLIILVSSMAGGTGSSMILDIADLLNGLSADVPKFIGSETAAFLYTADVFESWHETYKRAGGQTLGAVSELLHALTRTADTWSTKEWKQLVAAGVAPTEEYRGRGPRVIFPVGSKVDGKSFGENPVEIYRGFSRVLAPLLVSEDIQGEFKGYVRTNWGNKIAVVGDALGLNTPVVQRGAAVERYTSLFGGFGSATLSTGRDRYKEYAAQRIARRAAEILYSGFEQVQAEGQATTRVAKLQAAASQVYPRFKQTLNFDGLGGFDPHALRKKIIEKYRGKNDVQFAEEYLADLKNVFSNGDGQAIAGNIKVVLGQTEAKRSKGLADQANAMVVSWGKQMVQDLQEALILALAEFGAATADEVMELLNGEIGNLVNALKAIPNQANNMAVKNSIEEIGRIKKDVPPPAINDFKNKFSQFLQSSLEIQIHRALAEALGEFQTTFASNLRREITRLESDLQAELGKLPSSVTSAAYREAPLVSWPTGNTMPEHFNPAVNEVLLTPISNFVNDFKRDIVASVNGTMNEDDALTVAAKRVISRREIVEVNGAQKYGPINGWKDGDTKGNHPHFSVSESWVPARLSPTQNANPKLEILLEPAQLRELAIQWLNIPGNPFEIACNLNIASWINSAPQNADLFTQKLSETITLASPLVELDQNLISKLHGTNHPGTSYEFSAIPVDGSLPSIASVIKNKLSAGSTGAQNWTNFIGQCKPASIAQTISISGKTAPYSPWASKSITAPVNSAIESFKADGKGLGTFWTNMRARTLTQFVPLAEDRVQAFMRGWIIGRLTGRIQIGPARNPDVSEVRVYRDQTENGLPGAWLPFSSEVLGAPALGISNPTGGADSTGWNIPAILLESMSLALCRISAGNMGDWEPYAEVIRLGTSMYSIPGLGQAGGKPVALDNWLNGYDSSLGIQTDPKLNITDVDSAKAWIDSVLQDMKALSEAQVNGLNFWNIDAVYEIIGLIADAATLVKSELNRSDLGIKPSTAKPLSGQLPAGGDDSVIKPGSIA